MQADQKRQINFVGSHTASVVQRGNYATTSPGASRCFIRRRAKHLLQFIIFGAALSIGTQICNAQIISTVAGGGVGDGGPAINAPVVGSESVFIDLAGNLYIADRDNHRVRKVDVTTGIITTVAGTGVNISSGDNGSAINATLSRPVGVTVDNAGNVYISEEGSYRVRKVTAATGIITTVAGGGSVDADNQPATSARLTLPRGVAVDGTGNLFITEGHRIRKVASGTGIISTIAGDGTPGFNGDNQPATAAKLNAPSSIAFDIAGNLLIADRINIRIRKITVTTGIITTVAGNGNSTFSGDNVVANVSPLGEPYGIAVDVNDNLYIADQNTRRIRKVTAATGIMTTVAGREFSGFNGDSQIATNASLSTPRGVATDATGNVYIADQSINRIRVVTAATGIITTVAGNGTDAYTGGILPATSAALRGPTGVVFDAAGNFYIADSGNQRVRKVTAATGIISTVVGTGTDGFNGDNQSAAAASLWDPKGIALDTDGNLYIAEQTSRRIRKVNAITGVISTVAGGGAIYDPYSDNIPAVNATLLGPSGVAVDSFGNLFIAEYFGGRIRKVSAATGVITTAASLGGFTRSVAVDSVGNLYVSNENLQRIYRVDAATGTVTTIAGIGSGGFSGDNGPATNAELSYPSSVAFDADGSLFIADSLNLRIRRVAADTGIITTVAGTGSQGFAGDGGDAKGALLAYPRGLAFDSGGNLYIVEEVNGRIRKITPSVPGAPAIGNIAAGAGRVIVTFTAPASDGLRIITSYTANCAGQSATGSASPIVVSGLTNGVAVTCTVIATNALGGSPASNVSNSATPLELSLMSARSRKNHGGTVKDILIDPLMAIDGNVTTEPRIIGFGHQLVFQFNVAVGQPGTASAVDTAMTPVGATAVVNLAAANEVIVTLSGIADNQRSRVTLANVDGLPTQFQISLGFLLGDVNNTRTVNSSDISGVKARSGQQTDNSNFRFDVNLSGAINSSDISSVKARSGTVLVP